MSTIRNQNQFLNTLYKQAMTCKPHQADKYVEMVVGYILNHNSYNLDILGIINRLFNRLEATGGDKGELIVARILQVASERHQ